MRRFVFFLFFYFFLFNLYAHNLEDLLKNPSLFDKKVVEIEAEVVGEPLKEEDGVWINVKDRDKDIVLGVFIKDTLWQRRITHYGSYKERGDILKIKGVFHLFCPQHKTTDIHAYKIEIKEEGFLREEKISSFKIKLSFILGIICLTLALIYLIKNRIWKRR